MSKPQLPVPAGFPKLLKEIKARIQQAQTRAILAANAELVRLYWDIGRLIDQRQRRAGWGAAVIPRLARELRNELPEVKGFSERNIKLMVQFAHEYPDAFALSPHNWATGGCPIARSPKWATTRCPNSVGAQRAADTACQGTRCTSLVHAANTGQRLEPQRPAGHDQVGSPSPTGAGHHQLRQRLPAPQSDLARQTLKDPYIFDFLTLEEPFHERELETNLLHQLERFLLELGQGFAFVGRQLHLEVGDSDFYIDLLFYHLKLRCFVVIDLKKGEFKPDMPAR